MRLVDDWKQALKKYSVWAFIVIGAMPDIYTGMLGMGLLNDGALPQTFVWTIRILAAMGLALRLVKQQKAQA